MTDFTPGPWEVNPFNAQVDAMPVEPKHSIAPVCQLLWPTQERSEAETEANAHLIAAAPDMYEALSEAKEWIENSVPPIWGEGSKKGMLLAKIASALAKAEGRQE